MRAMTLAVLNAGQVADRAGDDRYPMPTLDQVLDQLIMAGATGIVQPGKILVNQQDMHAAHFTRNRV